MLFIMFLLNKRVTDLGYADSARFNTPRNTVDELIIMLRLHVHQISGCQGVPLLHREILTFTGHTLLIFDNE